MSDLAPIALFVFNRPEHTRQLLEALKANRLADQSVLYVFADGPKDPQDPSFQEVRRLIHRIDGFAAVNVVEREENLGLAGNVISGVTQVIDQYGKIIALEDDLISSPDFLEFMNDTLRFYRDDKRVWSITGFSFPLGIEPSNDVYLFPRALAWGWGTWKDRWEKADWNVADWQEFAQDRKAQYEFDRGGDLTAILRTYKENEAQKRRRNWLIRWSYSQFKNRAYTLYPARSKLKNIGYDGSGVNCSDRRLAQNQAIALADRGRPTLPRDTQVDRRTWKAVYEAFEGPLTLRIRAKKLLRRFGLLEWVRRIKGNG